MQHHEHYRHEADAEQQQGDDGPLSRFAETTGDDLDCQQYAGNPSMPARTIAAMIQRTRWSAFSNIAAGSYVFRQRGALNDTTVARAPRAPDHAAAEGRAGAIEATPHPRPTFRQFCSPRTPARPGALAQ